jgi:hypothetical protein
LIDIDFKDARTAWFTGPDYTDARKMGASFTRANSEIILPCRILDVVLDFKEHETTAPH